MAWHTSGLEQVDVTKRNGNLYQSTLAKTYSNSQLNIVIYFLEASHLIYLFFHVFQNLLMSSCRFSLLDIKDEDQIYHALQSIYAVNFHCTGLTKKGKGKEKRRKKENCALKPRGKTYWKLNNLFSIARSASIGSWIRSLCTFCWIFSCSCSVAVCRASLRAAIRISLSLKTNQWTNKRKFDFLLILQLCVHQCVAFNLEFLCFIQTKKNLKAYTHSFLLFLYFLWWCHKSAKSWNKILKLQYRSLRPRSNRQFNRHILFNFHHNIPVQWLLVHTNLAFSLAASSLAFSLSCFSLLYFAS